MVYYVISGKWIIARFVDIAKVIFIKNISKKSTLMEIEKQTR